LISASVIRERLAGLRLSPTREAEIVEELAQYPEDYYEDLLANGTAAVMRDWTMAKT
jgi:hypothetical protein